MQRAKEVLISRVLIIDDDEMVRNNIEEILVPRPLPQNELIESAARILFDEEDNLAAQPFTNHNLPVFTVDKAINGMDGVEKIKKSIADNSPYAVIFLDMRMPGWDGLETASRIRQIDTMAEIIIITAFSDKSIQEIVEKGGPGVGYHIKPYAAEEILQLATKGVNDYNKLRNLEKLISFISDIDLSKKTLYPLLESILGQLALYIGCDFAMLGNMSEEKVYQKLFSTGEHPQNIVDSKLSSIRSSALTHGREVEQIENIVFVKLDEYSVFAFLENGYHLNTEKLYLVKLFVENASRAIKNTRLHEELGQKEKLSIVGKALGMLIHDLRNPIMNIPVLTGLIREGNGAKELLDMIDVCVSQASEIFDDFIDFIREAPLQLQRVAISELIEGEIILARKKSLMENIAIITDLQPGLFMDGDTRKIKRVMMNLLNNAAEALKYHKIQNPTIKVNARKTEEYITITVEDNGPGVPEVIIEKVFEAFVTAGKSNGTGLGLAIVNQYVSAQGGTVRVLNSGGAQFIITFPLAI